MIPVCIKALAVASLLLTSLLQGCDGGEGYSLPQLEAARQPDFDDGEIAVYYISSEVADVVIQGVTHKIGHGVSQVNLPFSYEWEEDGDVDIQYNGKEHEVESPHDALDDVLEEFNKERKKGKVVPKKASAVRAKQVVPKTSTKKQQGL